MCLQEAPGGPPHWRAALSRAPAELASVLDPARVQDLLRRLAPRGKESGELVRLLERVAAAQRAAQPPAERPAAEEQGPAAEAPEPAQPPELQAERQAASAPAGSAAGLERGPAAGAAAAPEPERPGATAAAAAAAVPGPGLPTQPALPGSPLLAWGYRREVAPSGGGPVEVAEFLPPAAQQLRLLHEELGRLSKGEVDAVAAGALVQLATQERQVGEWPGLVPG